MKNNINFAKVNASLKRAGRVIGKRLAFLYLIFLLLGIGLIIGLIFLVFNEDDAAYREEKQSSLLQDVQLKQDKQTVDHVLQLETAGTGKIKPNYDPNRDNPFSE